LKYGVVVSIVIFLSIIFVPFVNAESLPSVTPNPATIGQMVTISFNGQTSVSLNITNPDGTWTYLRSGTKDYLYFTPTQIGNYNIQLIFSDNTTYPLTLEVQTLTPTSRPTPTATSAPTASPSPSPTAIATPTLLYTPTATPKPTFFPNPAITAHPSPTKVQTIISATTDYGATVELNISGNVTSSQITNINIATNQSSTATTISFIVTGQSGTSGFGNLTVPKRAVSYGTTAIVNIDGQFAQNQGFNQDSENYYIWFTTHFSAHEISIQFNAGASAQMQTLDLVQVIIIGVSATLAVVAVSAFVLVLKRGKN
jgi:hypothetical protein